LVLVLSLSACQTVTGPKFTGPVLPEEGQAAVYFYRPFNIMGGGDIPAIYDNGQKVLYGLPVRNWWRYETQPGTHVFKAKCLTARHIPATVEIEEGGEVHYLRLEYKFGVPFAFRLREVDQATAESEMSSLYQVKEE
jgi:hypothetical protein